MTDDPDNQIHVNVASVGVAQRHLSQMLTDFRSGDYEPLVFGEAGRPEGAVISFADLLRLFRYDKAAAKADQAELSDRLEQADRFPEKAESLDDVIDQMGDYAKATLARVKRDEQT